MFDFAAVRCIFSLCGGKIFSRQVVLIRVGLIESPTRLLKENGMKVTSEIYDELADAIDDVMSKHSLKVLVEHRQTVKFVKSQFIAFCWSMFHASKFGETHKEIYDTLNDSHIETALKHILFDFE